MRPKLLDLFCGAGGAAWGYHLAGWDVIGVDIEHHPDFPFFMVEMDALQALKRLNLRGIAAIHASPPCPRYSVATPDANRDKHPDLVGPIRDALVATGLPYVIENVPGSPLENPITLCGSMFGLGVRRHRLFESNTELAQPRCKHREQGQVFGVYGQHGDLNGPVPRPDGSSRGHKARDAAHAGEVMGISHMTKWSDLADAIPPAYTEHIGRQIMARLDIHTNEEGAA